MGFAAAQRAQGPGGAEERHAQMHADQRRPPGPGEILKGAGESARGAQREGEASRRGPGGSTGVDRCRQPSRACMPRYAPQPSWPGRSRGSTTAGTRARGRCRDGGKGGDGRRLTCEAPPPQRSSRCRSQSPPQGAPPPNARRMLACITRLHRGGVVLGHGLGALRHGVLGELTGQQQAHTRLDLAGRERRLLVVAAGRGGSGTA